MPPQWLRHCCAILALVYAAQDGSVASGLPKAPATSSASRAEADYRGGLVAPPLPKPRFILIDTFGRPFDFWQGTQGYVTLLFFGYTHCPGECPTHMANIADGLRELPATIRDQVTVVFVTADPARDNATSLREWLDHFDARFIGLTGSETAVAAAQRSANIPLASRAAGTNPDYAVGHASFVLAYTKDNMAHVIYPGGVSAKDWIHDLPKLAQETWSAR